MAINNNILTEVGDRLFLNAQIAVFGLLNIDSIVEEIDGEEVDRFFVKKFKWSKDNLNWSDWSDLTLLNVQELNDEYYDILFMSFYYERAGTSLDGYLQFSNLSFSGNLVVQINDYFTTQESIFKDFINNDTLTVSVANNLLKKIYKKGVLPTYLQRGSDDEDFIIFWSSICKYFSYLIGLANKFDDILNTKELLSEYLSQRGVKFVKDEITISDLQYISNNFFDELRKRGTLNTLKPKGFLFKDGSENPIDGEWLRLIAKNHYDEFLVEFIRKEDCGFFMNVSSNIYNGTNQSTQLNKTPENTEDFVDLDLFSFVNPSVPAYEIDTIDDKDVLKLTPQTFVGSGDNPSFGIGVDLSDIPVEVEEKFLIPVSSEIDYEFTFKIKRQGEAGEEPNFIKAGLLGFNLNNWYLPNSFKESKTSISSNEFFNKEVSSVMKTEEWYFIRCIIHSKNSSHSGDTTNDFGYKRLTFLEDAFKVMPYLQVSGTDSLSQVLIHDMKFRPLIRGKNVLKQISTNGDMQKIITDPYIQNPSFVQNDCAVLSWMKNNSESDDSDIENFINEYLLPYQKNLNNIRLSPKTDDKQLLT